MDPATLNALVRRWQLDELGLDQEANVARINARNAQEDLRRSNKKTIAATAANMADRGLARSGIATKVDMDRQQDFERASNRVDTQLNVGLADIAKKRLQGKAAYDLARAQLAIGMSPTQGSTSTA